MAQDKSLVVVDGKEIQNMIYTILLLFGDCWNGEEISMSMDTIQYPPQLRIYCWSASATRVKIPSRRAYRCRMQMAQHGKFLHS